MFTKVPRINYLIYLTTIIHQMNWQKTEIQ